MQSKSIFSLISFCLISMFFVPSVSAGQMLMAKTYVNIKFPKECGTWRKHAVNTHNCAVGPVTRGVGGTAKFTCQLIGGEGKGQLHISTRGKCQGVVLLVKQERGRSGGYYVSTITQQSGMATCTRGCGPRGAGKSGKKAVSNWVIDMELVEERLRRRIDMGPPY